MRAWVLLANTSDGYAGDPAIYFPTSDLPEAGQEIAAGAVGEPAFRSIVRPPIVVVQREVRCVAEVEPEQIDGAGDVEFAAQRVKPHKTFGNRDEALR